MSIVYMTRTEAGKPGIQKVDIRGGVPVGYSPRDKSLDHLSWKWVKDALKKK